MPAVLRQIFENVVETQFTNAQNDSFLAGIEDVSRYVVGGDEASVINRTYLGVKPDVLINNTTYPIPTQALTDENIPIVLDKYQTKVTPISDDELYAVIYNKVQGFTAQHATAIAETRLQKAAHSFAPPSNTAGTPVFVTTGAADASGRKALTKAEILKLKSIFDKKKIPMAGRRLILCPDHFNDILGFSETFAAQYMNIRDGLVLKAFGFEIYQFEDMPCYTVSTLVKKSFGSIPAANVDQMASVAVYVPRLIKAQGNTKAYFDEAKNNPRTQTNEMNFRTYFIAMPKMLDSQVAIVSGV